MMDENITGIDYAESKATQGINWLGKLIAVVVILSVAAFGDVMYIQLMQSVLPSGPLLVLCYIGAFTSFLGTVYLLIGKTSLFTPGKQTVFAWFVLGVELLIIGLNIVLVFHGAGDNQFLSAWTWIAPATPVIGMCLIAILFFLDEDQIEKHRDRALQSQNRAMERHYKNTVAEAQFELKHKQLEYLTTELQKAVNSPDSLAFIQQTALDMNAGLLSKFAGRNYGTPQPKTIEAGQGSGTLSNRPPVVLSQTTNAQMPKFAGEIMDIFNSGSTSNSVDKEVVTRKEPRPFHSPTNQRRNARWARKRSKTTK